MKVRIQFGDMKLEFPYEDFVENMTKGKNLLEAMMSKSNIELYYKIYENMPQFMLSYYEELSKLFEKYLDISKPGIGKIPDSPDVFAANGHDIFNYVARYGHGNFQCQAVLELDGRIDFDKLSKAVRLSVDAEPVLGCRFIEGNPPYWKRMQNIDKVIFCSLEEVTDCDKAVQSFIESPLDMDNDPNIKVKLMRAESNDIVGIKLNHAFCDGTGLKEYIQLLTDIYSDIDSFDGEFKPSPRARGREDQDKLLKALGITDPDALWIPGSDITIPTWAFPWVQGTPDTARIVICKLPMDILDNMSRYAKEKGATINDLILTAYYRAMLKMGKPVYGVPMGITITVDLRRYLPDNKTEAIRNFSGSVNTWLSMIEKEDFSDTLSRVVHMMKEIKNGYPGLQSAIGLERLEKISFKDTLAYYKATSKFGKSFSKNSPYYGNRCVATLSNMGIISKSLIKFDEVTVNNALIIPPVVSAPGILLEVGTYNGMVTMSAGFFEKTVLREDMEKLLNNIKDELVEGCK